MDAQIARDVGQKLGADLNATPRRTWQRHYYHARFADDSREW